MTLYLTINHSHFVKKNSDLHWNLHSNINLNLTLILKSMLESRYRFPCHRVCVCGDLLIERVNDEAVDQKHLLRRNKIE